MTTFIGSRGAAGGGGASKHLTIDITASQSGPVTFDLTADGVFYTRAGDTSVPNIGVSAVDYADKEYIAIYRNGLLLGKGNGDRQANWVSATSFQYLGAVDTSPGAGVPADCFQVLYR